MLWNGGIFDAFREKDSPTLYGPNKTPVTEYVLEVGLISALAALTFCLLLILPGIRGREKLFFLIRVLIGVFVLGSILLCNFGQEWEVARIHSTTQYRAGVRKHVKAVIGVKIGLRSVNITLKGDPMIQSFEDGKVNETINYNERFHWNNPGWTQGRNGFGPQAGLFNQEFRDAQKKGLPYPILWVAEYFTIDGDGIRWGRHFRQAGYYAHIMVWAAFPLWLLTMVLFYILLQYGATFMMLTGAVLLTANVIYATIRNSTPLVVPFTDAKLQFHWGWCFWLCLGNGVLCLLLGGIIFLLDVLDKSLTIFTLFGIDVAQDREEYYMNASELSTSKYLEATPDGFSGSQEMTGTPLPLVHSERKLRKRSDKFNLGSSTRSTPISSIRLSKRGKKSLLRTSSASSTSSMSPDADYVNKDPRGPRYKKRDDFQQVYSKTSSFSKGSELHSLQDVGVTMESVHGLTPESIEQSDDETEYEGISHYSVIRQV